MPQSLTSFLAVYLLLFLNLFFVSSGILYYKKIKKSKLLFFYSCITLIHTLLGIYVHLFARFNTLEGHLLDYSVNVIVLVEFIVFYLYIIKFLKSDKAKYLLHIAGGTIFITTILLWIFKNTIYKTQSELAAIEAFVIIVACLYYYYEIFIGTRLVSFNQSPEFWNITGMFFFCITIIPLTLQKNLYTDQNKFTNIYTITFIGYSILFISFINALRCQIKTRYI